MNKKSEAADPRKRGSEACHGCEVAGLAHEGGKYTATTGQLVGPKSTLLRGRGKAREAMCQAGAVNSREPAC
jgi:hypothetical protein